MKQAHTAQGFSVRVFIPDGDPDGLKLVEKSNWSGCGLVIPRTLLADAKARPELGRTGVYVLAGESDRSPLLQVYVGEGDPVCPRLEQHVKDKDFWTSAVVFTSKDQNLNKAHVQHLEARLVKLALASKRCVLDNRNTPKPPSLSEADTADVEGFLVDMLLCLPILGYDFFEPAPEASPETPRLVLKSKGIEASGFESSKGFVVQSGARAVKEVVASIQAFLVDSRAELVRQGVLADRGDAYEFTQDYAFSSPSTAAGVILGRSANGRIEWKTRDGKTLKDLQEAEAGV